MSKRPLAAAGAAGLAVTAAAAAWAGMGGHGTAALLGWSAGGATVAGLAAAALLRALRGARVVTQAVIAALTPVVAVAAGVWGAARAMFISAHDLHALMVVLAGAGTVAVVTAMALGSRVAGATASLGHLASRIGADPDPAADPAADPAGGSAVGSAGGSELTAGPPARAALARGPGDLADVAAQLDAALGRLAESRQRAAALEASRRELVAWVSHDLRTPLAGIRAMVEALEDGLACEPATVARYYRTMGRETERLAAMVDDLFELSRIHAGALSLDLEAVALDELVSEAVAGASVAADAKGVGLLGRVGAPAPVVELSIPEMARAVRNLVDNAIRHTPPGGTVSIEASVDPPTRAALVSVSDGCGGIPAADLARVFELAYRGDAARTPSDGGAGLGLAVAQGLVQAHQGDISVCNEGPGCRFTIRLPLAPGRR